jgi:hypothetical protein
MKAVAGGSTQRNSITGNQQTRINPARVRLNHRFSLFNTGFLFFRLGMATSLPD